MSRALLVSVRFSDGRYHGEPEWPPSPARLFQALVAGAAGGRGLSADVQEAFRWLEALEPPIIAAPPARRGRAFKNYVPNNDLDSVGGDPGRISEIRTAKTVRPRLFDARTTLLYAWQFEQGEAEAGKIGEIAERLYQLGRGVDMAWAWAETIDAAEVEQRLARHGGTLYRPIEGQGMSLLCPQNGSLESLEDRFEKAGKRFTAVGRGRKAQQLFSQAPKPRFRSMVYDSPPQRLLFDLRRVAEGMEFATWPLARVASLAEYLRDGAVERLRQVISPDEVAHIERAVVGRGASEADKTARIRIMPIPSTGSQHVVRSIRRVLVEVPGNCPLPSEKIRQAFSGLPVFDQADPETGEVVEVRLIAADDDDMLRHYAIGSDRSGRRMWRTVTAAALPERAARRRIDPPRLRVELAGAGSDPKAQFKEAKGGRERLAEEARAAAAVGQALRHAGISVPTEAIRVQREPFESRGVRAEAFADGTRFAKERLWHVEIAFAAAIRGPVVIGDGRYLGLGLMAPVQDMQRDMLIFPVPTEAGIRVSDGPALVRAARRALMALARDRDGRVSRLFSGHETDGRRAASGRHEHVFLAADDGDRDGVIDRLIVAAPWACDRSVRPERGAARIFEEIVSGLEVLRAGKLGVLALGRPGSGDDALFGPGRVWESRTPYRATRHAGRRKDPRIALVQDMTIECLRRGLPRPEVEVLKFSALPNGGGLATLARLRFATAVSGPLLLGRDSHQGGGLFASID
jgi:CRISPR-associated protein Csb2